LLAILNTCDVTETLHQAPQSSTSSSAAVQKPEETIPDHQSPVVKKRRKNDEISFQIQPLDEFVRPIDSDPSRNNTAIRYAAQELFLPDNSLIYGRQHEVNMKST